MVMAYPPVLHVALASAITLRSVTRVGVRCSPKSGRGSEADLVSNLGLAAPPRGLKWSVRVSPGYNGDSVDPPRRNSPRSQASLHPSGLARVKAP